MCVRAARAWRWGVEKVWMCAFARVGGADERFGRVRVLCVGNLSEGADSCAVACA